MDNAKKRQKSKNRRDLEPIELVIRLLSRRMSFCLEYCELMFCSDDDIFDYAAEHYPKEFSRIMRKCAISA